MAAVLTLSYTGGGGGGTLASKIRIFAINTATVTTFGDFSYNLSGNTMACWLNPYQLSRFHGNHFFKSRFDNFHINLLKIILFQVYLFKRLIWAD